MTEETSNAVTSVSRRLFIKTGGVSAIGAALSGVAEAAQQGVGTSIADDVLGPDPAPVTLNINGRDLQLRVDPAATLVEVIRNDLGLTGTKIGCDRGACSACTVWLDGEPASSCMTLALDARGRRITTIEGLAEGDKLHPLQQAFVDHDAMQCGFCTPGMVMSCAALLNRNPNANLDDVKSAISGHLCRCGAYPNIFKATLAVATRKQALGR
jgi:xanthine dehydrogenase YagT iron-sulfur-binding subunit